jgi:arylsulfatase A-like enzyme
MIVRKLFLLALCVPGIVFAERPNILFVVADDQGWNDVGYHNDELRTPHIDKLCRSGIELDCHYVQPQCTPTRVALMTGRYPSRFGSHCTVASNDQSFPHGTLTMASMLKSAGYATGMSGKWHMGSKPEWGPNRYGFDYSHGSLAGAVGMYDHRYRLNSPFAKTWHRNCEFIEEEGHVTDLTAAEAVRWIKSHAADDSPWFFYVPFHAVHTPLVERDARWHDMNAHIADDERRLYAAALSHMDDAVGQMIEALESTGQRQRTLVIYTSDNGAQVNHGGNTYPPPDPKLTQFSSNKPLRGTKTETFEGGYRVPAFVNWPGTLDRGKVDAPLHVVDWMPTLANLVGYERDEDPAWDGIDVWPVIGGQSNELADRPIYIVWGTNRNREALRYGSWKIVRNGGKEWMLFNLADDPNEKTNLAMQMPQRVAQLLSIYEECRQKDAPKKE